METVKEGSSAYLRVKFYDKDGVLAVPASVTWEAHDKATKTELQPATPVTPAEIVEIAIPSTVNALHDSLKQTEIREITVKATYGVADHCNDVYEYQVKNLAHVP